MKDKQNLFARSIQANGGFFSHKDNGLEFPFIRKIASSYNNVPITCHYQSKLQYVLCHLG